MNCSIEIPSRDSIPIVTMTLLLFASLLIASNLIGIPSVEAVYVFSNNWGTPGSGNGQFSIPIGLAESSGNVYVADTGNNRIQNFGSTGTFIRAWGTPGSGNGQFNVPHGITVSSGNVYVADTGNSRIQVFKLVSPCPPGTIQIVSGVCFIRAWGTPGSGNGQFNTPTGIAVDSSGNVYVADLGNNRIQKFGSTGSFIRAWGTPGSGEGQFNSPFDLTVDPSGNVYVSEIGNNRIQKFGSTGSFIRAWGTPGSGDGQFNTPTGITISSGNVYVADNINNRIQKFTSTGTFVTKLGTLGSNNGQFNAPNDVAVRSSDIVLSERVYVADTGNTRIQVFVWKPVIQP